MRRCPECGVPLIIRGVGRWMPNGTLVNPFNHYIRHTFVEADFIPSIRDLVSQKIGVNVNPIFFEAQRNAICLVVEPLLREQVRKAMAHFSPLKHLTMRFFNSLAAAIGMGHSETVKYEPGKLGVARVRNPFDLDLMGAVVCGAFEALEGKPYGPSWQKKDEDFVLTVRPIAQKPEISSRFVVGVEPTQPGEYTMPTCPHCHLPLELRHLEWIPRDGIILDRRRGVRMIGTDAHAPSMVIREMAEELGLEAIKLALEVSREYTVRLLQDLRLVPEDTKGREEEIYWKLVELMPLHGQGLVTHIERKAGCRLEITVINPYDHHLIAGRLQGYYEQVEKIPASVTYDFLKKNHLKYSINSR